MFMCNNYWYLFLRLHHMLCERLSYIYQEATKRAQDAEAERLKSGNAEPTAEMLGLRPKRESHTLSCLVHHVSIFFFLSRSLSFCMFHEES